MCAVNQSRTVLPLPTGYSTRPATEADAETIYGLIHDYDVSMVGYSDFALDDLLEFFREEHFNIDHDSCLVLDQEGRLAGYSMIWAREPHRRYTAFAIVHPEDLGRGIGTGLLGFLEPDARTCRGRRNYDPVELDRPRRRSGPPAGRGGRVLGGPAALLDDD